MPVRSRGSLLAGTATFAGLLLAGFGCHSSPSDHDSFSLPNQPTPTGGSLLSSGGDPAVIAASPASQPVRYSPAPPAAPGTGRVTLQPVPMVQTAQQNREVIASTFQPVQRVSAEMSQSGTMLQGGAPGVVYRTALVPTRTASIAPMPVGTPSAGNGPTLEGGDTAPGNLVLPAPRPLGSPPVTVVHDGVMPPHAPYHSAPREFEKMTLPPYVVEPPDILLIQASNRITLRLQPITGQHLVAPDGTVNLGIYGQIRVAGMTLDQVGDAVAARLIERMPGLLGNLPELDEKGKTTGKELRTIFREGYTSTELIKREMQVDVLAYNSKFYYVITDGGGYGQQVYPMPIRGNETVLDAMANINGLPSVANKKRIWVARATRAGQPPNILPVDWMTLAKCGSGATNYQLFPGDRVYVDSNHLIKADTFLSKLLSPAQRVLGVTLLGASTVNSIKFGALSGSGIGGFGGFR